MIGWTKDSDEITQVEYAKWKSKNETIQVRRKKHRSQRRIISRRWELSLIQKTVESSNKKWIMSNATSKWQVTGTQRELSVVLWGCVRREEWWEMWEGYTVGLHLFPFPSFNCASSTFPDVKDGLGINLVKCFVFYIHSENGRQD